MLYEVSNGNDKETQTVRVGFNQIFKDPVCKFFSYLRLGKPNYFYYTLIILQVYTIH